jgi:SAM-dependent methyltransferase
LECQISDTELYQKFDFAICFELFQFFILEDFYKALENVGLFLKPGGIFLLMVPNCGNPYLFPYLAYSDPYNKMKFTPESLYRILKVNGSFKVLKIIRWNSANSYFKIFIRNLFQKLFSLICHRLMSIFFQVGGNINKNIFTDNIYMSSHIAAILRKEETES